MARQADESLVGLELQNKTQTFIDGALQARRQRAGELGQQTTVEGHECDTFATESRGRPVERAGNRTLPGTSASSKLPVSAATIAV